ncbi:hypothetical protein CSC74_08585 [Pseudoxanthomonas yeongjuensis]|uniref:hypothetical protein n=1 Tax=Pseudoxanthomonas yeongjuensis TaxID=377616 RepID=UPI001390D4B9|nr:hypothetical protein [Pseudoxanthomonas yeongjuensis]KAF1716914.1 hypothetical protein CSC74_08585 [Pseudoxanthomonas yeongjuensis]
MTLLASTLANQPLDPFSIAIMFCFACVYALGIAAGLWMLEGHRHAVALNLVFWALQVPQLHSPVASYLFWAPAKLGIWWNVTASKVGLSCQVGSSFQFSMFSAGMDFILALNLFALACSLYLYVLYRRQYPATRIAAEESRRETETGRDPAETTDRVW